MCLANDRWNQHQTHESRVCGYCNRPRPESKPFYANPPGWSYVMVRSGMSPVYKWQCPECSKPWNLFAAVSGPTSEDHA